MAWKINNWEIAHERDRERFMCQNQIIQKKEKRE